MNRWAAFVVDRRWWVLGLAVVVVVLAGVWGTGVFGRLSQGGFYDPGSESAEVQRIVDDNFGPQTADIIAIYTPPPGRTVADIGPEVTAVLDRFAAEVPTRSVDSYWSATPPAKQLLLSKDGGSAAAAVTLEPGSEITVTTFQGLLPRLEVPGVDAQFAGNSVVGVAFTTRLERDLLFAEAIALPVTLVLLVFIFGGLVAAAVPVFVGVLAVLSALATLRLLTMYTEVSSFALNVTSLIGLGLAIDYGLFIVSRFREELDSGADPASATRRTVLTAGRTVMFSGLLLMCAFAGMLVFPQALLRSLGLGAIAAVLSAAVLSLTAIPALLAILGHHINALTWREGAARRGEARARRFWGSVVTKVMRRPALVAVTITAGLLLLATPLLRASFGEIEYTALPAGDPARAATQTLLDEFPSTGNGVTLVLRGDDGSAPAAVAVTAVSRAAADVDGIAQTVTVAARNDVVVLQALYAQGGGGDAAGERDRPGATGSAAPAGHRPARRRRPGDGRRQQCRDRPLDARDDRGHGALHPGAAVPGIRVRGAPAQGGGDGGSEPGRHVRRAHLGVPARQRSGAARRDPQPAGAELRGADPGGGVRPVNRLRGVPDVAHGGGPGRRGEHGGGGTVRHRAHRPGGDLGGVAADRGDRRVHDLGTVDHAVPGGGDDPRADHRRDRGADAAGAVAGQADGRGELVGTGVDETGAREGRHRTLESVLTLQ